MAKGLKVRQQGLSMTAKLIDGKQIAAGIRTKLKKTLEQQSSQGMVTPGLAVILIGNNPASKAYVGHKQRACKEVGIASTCYPLAEDVSADELQALIHQLNDDARTHGILLQLPLPAHLNPEHFLESIAPHKDVDGFHPYNFGRLALRQPTLRPCTPHGVITLLKHTQSDLSGKHVIIIGASNIVGRPMALECLLEKCTVTLCHRYTRDLASIIPQGDIVIAAIGKPGIIKSDWLKPGCTVIDVGFSRLDNGKISGDIDFASAKQRAAWITPVPGGVGPMTVATLLENTLYAARHAHGN